MTSERPELVAQFVFGKRFDSTIVEMTSDEELAWIKIREEDEHEDAGHDLYLDPQEIDLFIAALSLFKYKILNPRKDVPK